MDFLKKYILFLLLLPQVSIKSAYMFKDLQGEFRELNVYDQKDLKNLDYSTIPSEQTFIGFGPNDKYAKIAFLEEKANGKYQVHYFTLLNPNKSTEFTNKEDAQFALLTFMLEPAEQNISKKSYFIPLPARGSGQNWRSTSSSRNTAKKR